MGMVQKRPLSGNTRDLSADPDRSRIGAGIRESLVAVLGLQFRENRVYPLPSRERVGVRGAGHDQSPCPKGRADWCDPLPQGERAK